MSGARRWGRLQKGKNEATEAKGKGAALNTSSPPSPGLSLQI